MRKNVEIVLDALFKRIPVKLGTKVHVAINDSTYVMCARKDSITGKKEIDYLEFPLTLDFLIKESKKLSEVDISNIILALIKADEYFEKYNELPEVFHIPEYEEELLNCL